MGAWDTKPTEEHWRRLFQVIKIINSNPNLPIYMYHHHDSLLTLERIAEEEGFKLRCWGVCVKDDKHDAGGNHLINNCTMYSFFTFGLPDKIYWLAPKNPTAAERTNVIHYTGPSKWFRKPNGEILNPCQKSGMIEKIWIDRHTRKSPDSYVLSLYSGSGTTAAVAMKLGRSSVSVDNRECQVENAFKRLCELKLSLGANNAIDDDGFTIKLKAVSSESNTDQSSSDQIEQSKNQEIDAEQNQQQKTACHACKKDVNEKKRQCSQCKHIFCDSNQCVKYTKSGSENGPFYCSNTCLTSSGVSSPEVITRVNEVLETQENLPENQEE
jgi:hypothetical protein